MSDLQVLSLVGRSRGIESCVQEISLTSHRQPALFTDYYMGYGDRQRPEGGGRIGQGKRHLAM